MQGDEKRLCPNGRLISLSCKAAEKFYVPQERGRLIMDLGNYGGRLESYKIDAKGKLQIEKSFIRVSLVSLHHE